MPNRLIHEQSPYLQQHAHNPVEWYPWGEEAFEKALQEEKPIFLSIGYSSCHWCHVMEREIFEVEKFAEILNTHYVSIKVDREERPDIDRYYQELHHVMTGRAGGWPTSIFLTHTKEPIHAATYIPPVNKYNMPAFDELILGIQHHYENKREEIMAQSAKLHEYMQKRESKVAPAPIVDDFIETIKKSVSDNYDDAFGGFGTSPKFPHAATLDLMREAYLLSRDETLKTNLEFTLRQMAKGAMYDLVEGGFCRYSVDHMWWIPHFEKMTYDNGLLAQAYLKMAQMGGESFFEKIGHEILDFMLERMSESHLFYSASDADTDGVEGKYFVYLYHEVMDKLQENGFEKLEADSICRHLSISARGNFEERQNAVRNESLSEPEWFPKVIGILKEMRSPRNYPFIDKKIIVSWNAMMIKAFFIAGRTQPRYLAQAKASLHALLESMYRDGILYHSVMIGHTPQIEAFLEDYAFLCGTLMEAYQCTLDESYLEQCEAFAKEAIARFYHEKKWYLSRGEFETLAEGQDSSYTSAVGEMLNTLLSLALLRDPAYFEVAEESITYYMSYANKHAIFFGSICTAALRIQHKDKVIKADRESLLKLLPEMGSFSYPYLLIQPQTQSGIQVCTLMACLEQYESIAQLTAAYKEV